MSTRSIAQRWAVAAGLAAAGAVLLVVDVWAPPGVVAEVAYGALVLIALRFGGARLVLAAAGLASALVVVGWFLSAPEGADAGLVNRVIALGAIWAMAAVAWGRKRAELEHDRIVVELDYRVRNILTAVLSVADQTVARARSLEDFTPAFAGRLRALSIAHEQLARTGWRRADLGRLVDRILEPYRQGDPERFEISGPEIGLSAELAPSISMALHELATNASRHGALATFNGRVAIDWGREIDPDGGGRLLRIRWREIDGPRVSPPDRRGFGTTLLERMIAYQTKGHARLDFDEEGVRCEIVLPMSEGVDR